jgi:hypothetical protein
MLVAECLQYVFLPFESKFVHRADEKIGLSKKVLPYDEIAV